MSDLLVIIDMINGFVNNGQLADKNINRIVPSIEALIQKHGKIGQDMIVFVDTHKKNDPEFNEFPPHCIKGTKECELIPELKKYEKFFTIIEKPTTNGFDTPQFKREFVTGGYDKVIVCGCCTDICVYNFVKSFDRFLTLIGNNAKIEIYPASVDTFNAPNHNADEINKTYLAKMKNECSHVTIKTKEIKENELV